ncbi:MAG: SDR family NAD(P)-dependent oxidoreductase [Myxococcota bacterium]
MSFRERYGPWALVAGASDGIGEAFARGIAARGVNVLLLARREALLQELAARIRAEHGVEARPLVADLTGADLEDRIDEGTRALEVGLLVYNAGAVHGVGAFHELPRTHAEKLIALNCTGPVLLAHALGGAMRARGRGGIVLVTSMVALAGSAHVATYAATKAFDLILAQSLWHELQPSGVDVLGAVVGMTRTPSLLATEPHFPDGVEAMEPQDVAPGALDFLGRGPVWFAGETNRAASKGLAALPRPQLIDTMSRLTGSLYGLPHVAARGEE